MTVSYQCYRTGLLLGLGLVCLLLPGTARAQRRMTAMEARQAREQEMRNREYNLSHAGEVKEVSTTRANLLPVIQEDFRKLQLVNNDMMKQVAAAETALDYRAIARATGDIGRRAGRLKTNISYLLIPSPATAAKDRPEAPAPADAAAFRRTLFQLDELIMRFVSNPQFKGPGVVAADSADQAHKDLQAIIDLSRVLHRSAERLGRNASPTP